MAMLSFSFLRMFSVQTIAQGRPASRKSMSTLYVPVAIASGVTLIQHSASIVGFQRCATGLHCRKLRLAQRKQMMARVTMAVQRTIFCQRLTTMRRRKRATLVFEVEMAVMRVVWPMTSRRLALENWATDWRDGFCEQGVCWSALD